MHAWRRVPPSSGFVFLWRTLKLSAASAACLLTGLPGTENPGAAHCHEALGAKPGRRRPTTGCEVRARQASSGWTGDFRQLPAVLGRREAAAAHPATAGPYRRMEAPADQEQAQRSASLFGVSQMDSIPPLQRRVLCKGERSAKESALQRSVLCRGECSAKQTALQRECSAKESALQRRVLCKGECSAALQRRVLCKGDCSAKKCALQRRYSASWPRTPRAQQAWTATP